MVILDVTSANLSIFWDSFFQTAFSNDTIMFSLLLLTAFVYFMLIARIKSGGVVVTGLSVVYLVSIFNPAFKFLFFLAIIASAVMFIMGVKNNFR